MVKDHNKMMINHNLWDYLVYNIFKLIASGFLPIIN